jgi:hypothetical protein
MEAFHAPQEYQAGSAKTTKKKKQFPNWKRLSRKTKKELAKNVPAEVANVYDFKQDINAPIGELLTIETQFQPRASSVL